MKASEYAQTPDPDGVRRFVLFCQRQADDGSVPPPYPAVHGDGAAVEPGRLLHHEQAQAAAVLSPGRRPPGKKLEDALPGFPGRCRCRRPGRVSYRPCPSSAGPPITGRWGIYASGGRRWRSGIRQQPGQQGCVPALPADPAGYAHCQSGAPSGARWACSSQGPPPAGSRSSLPAGASAYPAPAG